MCNKFVKGPICSRSSLFKNIPIKFSFMYEASKGEHGKLIFPCPQNIPFYSFQQNKKTIQQHQVKLIKSFVNKSVITSS